MSTTLEAAVFVAAVGFPTAAVLIAQARGKDREYGRKLERELHKLRDEARETTMRLEQTVSSVSVRLEQSIKNGYGQLDEAVYQLERKHNNTNTEIARIDALISTLAGRQ